MGYFKDINLIHFRNFDSLKLDFSKNCNILFGKNGSGKTNILEAISLFSKGRGFKKDKILNIIKSNHKSFNIQSDFQNSNIIYKLNSQSYEINHRILKTLTINGDKDPNTLDEFYKLAPLLVFVPETERLFLASPLNRRNFIDRLIFTQNYTYNKLVNEYNKNILERSKLLNSEKFDKEWLDVMEKNIASFGLQIYQLRKKQINIIIKHLNYFLNEFKVLYQTNVITSDKFYNNNLNEEYYLHKLKNNREIDALIGGSKIGPHKTDYIFTLENDFLVSQLSTGQQKTFILLIFLAQCKHLKDLNNKEPILLLDEVCSHLDDVNRGILLTLVESFDLQIFMTGTTRNLFSFLSTNSNFCNITT